MRNTRYSQQGVPDRGGGSTQNLYALRGCETRIRDLQQLAGSRDRDARLRSEAGRARQLARVCVAQGDFRNAGAADLAAMVNRFSKLCRYPVAGDMDTVMACIGTEVGRRGAEGSLADWSAWHLSLVANGFSKGRGPWVQAGLDHLAQALLAIGHLRVEDGWTAQHLAMMANGLDKGQGDSIRAALTHLAQALLRVPQLTPEAGWDVLPLALMTNALAKCQGRCIPPALTHLAQGIIRVSRRTPPSAWAVQHLAMMINGLAKGEGPAVSQALTGLARAVSEQELSVRRGWNARSLAMVASGLGKEEGVCIEAALQHLACGLLTGPPLTAERGWTGQHIAMMANGLSKGSGPDIQAALTHLARGVIRAGDLTPASGWSLRCLAMLANALARAEGPEVRQALASIARSISARQSGPDQPWCPQDLAMMACGLSKSEEPCIQRALTHLAREVIRLPHPAGASAWTAQSLAMTLSGLGWGEGQEIREALSHLARELIRFRHPVPGSGWSVRQLAMMLSGLSKGEGNDIKAALACLARDTGTHSLAAMQQWQPRDLAMIAAGLAKGEGKEVHKALTSLARVVLRGASQTPASWSARDLAMMTHGLGKGEGKGEGKDIRDAITHLARAVPEVRQLTPERMWNARHLAMMASGLSRGDRFGIQEALARLAQALEARELTVQQGWTTQSQVMMATALARGEGAAIRQGLARLAGVVNNRPLMSEPEWATRDLAMMMAALGQTQAGHAAFDRLTAALVSRADKDPHELIHVLRALSRFALSACHLKAGRRLLDALRAAPVRAYSSDDRDEVLWSATLLHFASQRQQPVDPELGASFARACQDALSDMAASPGAQLTAPPDPWHRRWHRRWASDYWQASGAWHRGLAAGGCVRGEVSGYQQQVFDRLRADLPGRVIEMEAPVNHFPVDILIDDHLCVEVDGPWHFVEAPAATGDKDAGDYTRQGRTKDLFIDHMLHRYGYRLLRLTDVKTKAGLDACVRQVRAALGAQGQAPATAAQEKTPAQRDTGHEAPAPPQQPPCALLAADVQGRPERSPGP